MVNLSIEEVQEQLSQCHSSVNALKRIPVHQATPALRKNLKMLNERVMKLRDNLKQQKGDEMKRFYDIWEVQKGEIIGAKKKDIESVLKKKYQKQADILRTELVEKANGLNDLQNSITQQQKSAQYEQVATLANRLMTAWRVIDDITPKDQLDSVTKNLEQALYGVMVTRLKTEFEGWEWYGNKTICCVKSID